MLNIWKYLLFSIVLMSSLAGDILTWGGYSKLDITKSKTDAIIKAYVDKTYPEQVKEYNQKLSDKRESKLQSISDVTFVSGNLMWQDTEINSSLILNQLEARKYCKRLKFVKRKDWRIPSYLELLEFVDYSQSNPAVSQGVKYIVSKDYWSGTQKKLKGEQKPTSYWYVDFSSGESSFSNVMNKKHVRCVRTLSSKKDDY